MLLDWNLDKAISKLEAEGFQIGKKIELPDEEMEEGKVIKTGSSSRAVP